MAANEVVYYHSGEVGAPVHNNAASSTIGVLDACLVTGFRPITLTSLSVSGGVATATFAGHGYEADRLIDIGGAAVGALNGRKRILSVASGTFTFDATGVTDNAAVGGTITCKRSPLGWVKLYAGTNKAIYQRTDPLASSQLLRVLDPAGVSARTLVLESATDIDTYAGQGPTETQVPGGHYWHKGADTTTAKPWVLIGDSRGFYFLSDPSNYPFASYGGLQFQGFVDVKAYREGDAYRALLMGTASVTNPNLVSSNTAMGSSGGYYAAFLSRSYSQLGLSVPAAALSVCAGVAPGQFGSGQFPAFPSPVDNGLDLEYPVRVREDVGTTFRPIRGLLPGLAFPLGPVGATLHKQIVPNVIGLSRHVLSVAVSMNTAAPACVFFDETGPWQ